MHTLRDTLTWSVSLALLTGLIPGWVAVIFARSRQWSVERTRSVARWIAVGLSISWWLTAVYGFQMLYPYDWIGATIGTPVRVLAFTAWCLSPAYLAPLIAAKVYRASASEASEAR
jgi:cytochrome b subunit of formate dehydrogenase